MHRIIVTYLFCVCATLMFAQQTLYLPYDATKVSDEQKSENPVYLAYPPAVADEVPVAQCKMKGLGPFSVSADHKVIFSQGNLQYQASTDTWRFAQHQWDFVGDDLRGNVYEDGNKSDNSKISPTYSGWIDLFGWGTSGWNSGANEYQPYSVSMQTEDYYPGGNYENNLSGLFMAADWCVYNKIGSFPRGMWRTLSRDEWFYIFRGRENADKLFALGSVNGVSGIILLPDDWVKPDDVSFVASTTAGLDWNMYNDNFFNSRGNNYSHNIYTEQQWQRMEAAGAVFLPAAGFRSGTVVSLAGIQNYYWSVSHFGLKSAYFLYSSSILLVPHSCHRPRRVKENTLHIFARSYDETIFGFHIMSAFSLR